VRTRLVTVTLTLAWLAAAAPPALAQTTPEGAKPWHYWVAPILLVSAVLLLVGIGVGYYVRVMGGRRR
jgi:hypothetical protein